MDKMVGFLDLWLSTLFIGWHVEWIKITMHTGEKFLCSFNAWLDDGKPGSVGPPSKTSICNQGNSCACLMVAKKRPNASSNSHFQLYRTACTYICNTTQNIYMGIASLQICGHSDSTLFNTAITEHMFDTFTFTILWTYFLIFIEFSES